MINIRMQDQNVKRLTPKITVVGVGGAGGNAVNNMISSGLQGVDFLVCNTDAQALENSLCETKLQLGAHVTEGLGAGARPEVGRDAAEESMDELLQYLEGSNMAFITAGMGGGTGTGGAPVIAKACREKGILTVGVVTKPFHFEGSLRMKMAEQGIEEMQQYVDTLIVIPNQNLFRVANEKTTFAEAFKMADSVLQSGVRGVTDLMVMPGLINLDFADIRSAMMEMGKAMMGTGEATEEGRAIKAAEAAINNPLLDDVTMKGARGVIINVTGGYDMTLFEVDEACNRIRDEVDPNANIIFGSTFDESLDGIMRVSVVATGIDAAENRAHQPNGSFVRTTVQPTQVERPVQPVEQKSPAVRTPPGAALPPLPLNVRPAASAARHVADISHPAVAASEPVVAETSAAETVGEPVAVTKSYEGKGVRGHVYNDAFIPPKPVEADQRHAAPSAPEYQVQVENQEVQQSIQPQQTVVAPDVHSPELSAQRSVEETHNVSASAGSNLTLKPPVVGSRVAQHQEEKRKTASLFERFTSQLRGSLSDGDKRTGEETGTATGTTSSSGSGGLTVKPSVPTQGSLNIDTAQSGESEEELDIPAFLRRQAN